MVERFANSPNPNGLGFSNGVVSDDNGCYVRYPDYATLAKRLEGAEASRDHWIGENRRNLKNGQDAAYELEAVKTEHAASRENFHTMQNAANVLRKRLEAAEARAAQLEAENGRLLGSVHEAFECVTHALMVLPVPERSDQKRAYGSLVDAKQALDAMLTGREG